MRPTGVEPVKDSFRRRGSAITGAETSAAPGGRHDVDDAGGHTDLASRSTNSRVVSGVSSAGLTTTVQPAASAGAILRVAIASGKFHGVIRNAGPTGLCETVARPVPSGLVPYEPPIRTASSENQRRNSPP